MNYKGKLYGHLGGKKYFDTGRSADDWGRLLQALEELVQVKEWKDKHGKDEHYIKAQPIAWRNANELLKELKP